MRSGLRVKRIGAMLLALVCAGCVLRAVNIDELPQPVPHRAPAPEWRSEFDEGIDKPRVASLGDTMFVVSRYYLRRQLLNVAAPMGMATLPPADRWSMTHTR